jgi:NADPH-dependent glutamate synthase beta subunit-like oxidoreductase/Pyruvate/2-oxoacid:ferredoxin oxidoreductase delta subunit
VNLPVTPDAKWLWDNEPCRAACPVNTDAGAYVTAIGEGRFADAYVHARAHNPFPSICGRVCAAPCESACRRGKVDLPVSIRALKRFVTEQFGIESFAGSEQWHAAHGPVPEATLTSVGIIGAGPAGMSAAHDLRLAGHPVVVYEAESQLGGMIHYGVPEYRLPRALIERENEAIIELGVEVQRNCRIGVDIQFSELLERHGAILVAVGAARGRDLQIPGHDLDGVTTAIEFLLNVNRGYRVTLGEKVVVVGGGNVAFDAARTALRDAISGTSSDDDEARRELTTSLDAARAALRAGVKEVTVVSLESFDEMPAALEEIEEAEKEGVKIRFRRGPRRVTGDGKATGLETIGVAAVFDEQGRFSPTFNDGTEDIIDADTVIFAVGQAPDISFLGDVEVEKNRFGGVAVNDELRSSDPRIWSAGDVAFGPRNLINAVADGQRAAASIHAALTNAPQPSAHEVRIELVAKPRFRRLATDYDSVPRQHIPGLPQDRRTGFAEVETGYGREQAVLEGQRCLRCFENIMLRPELCILCGLCVDVCPYDCIAIVRADNIGAGTSAQSALTINEESCIRCGLCINRCPPAALVMVHAQEVTS